MQMYIYYFYVQAFEELRAVFTTAFAHKAYMLFYRCIHTEMMEHILKNHEHIQQLCHDYEQEIKATSVNNGRYPIRYFSIIITINNMFILVFHFCF